MRGIICGVWALFAVAGLLLPVAGQVTPGRATDVPKTPQRVNLPLTPRLPSTATFKITRVAPQSDGTTLTIESTKVLAWDSQRRQMTSILSAPPSDEQTPTTHFSALDRDAQTVSRWSVPGDQVTVMNLPEKLAGRSLCVANLVLLEPLQMVPMPKGQHGRPETKNLGTATIQGVEVRGSRTTITFSAGTVGNSEPAARTTEVWMATEPGVDLVVRSVIDDPISGQLTSELQDLDLNEPDPRIFQPPPEYRIVHQDYPKCPSTDGKARKRPR
jgi:hypothetical protein